MIFRPRISLNNSSERARESLLAQGGFKPLLLLAFACFFYGISVGIDVSSFSLFLDKFDLSAKKISQILAMEIIGNITIAPFLLLLTNRFGLFNLLIIALIIRNSCLAIFGLGDNLDIWYLSMFGFGIGGFVLYTGIFQWINSLAEDKFRATCLSIASASFGLGIAIGPLLIMVLDISIGHMTFIVSLAICSIMLIPIVKARRYQPKYYTHHGLSIHKLFVFAQLPIMCAIASEYIFFSMAEFLPLFALGKGKLQGEAYMLAAYFNLAGLMLGVPAGMIMDRYNRLRMIMIFSLSIAVTMQMLPLVINNLLLTLLVFAILGASINGIIIGGLAILGDKFKGDDFVAANSTVHAMSTIGGFAGITTTGYAMDRLGDKGLIFSVSALFLVFLALLLLEAYKYNRKWQRS